MSRRQYALPQRGEEHPPDDTGCTVLHVDMDAFYASASLLSRPELVGTPVIIGGGGNRGVVLSATYEARKFGVASAMPMSRARRLCPQATVIAPDHHLYSQISAAVMATFETITPVVEPLSLDEAFLDVSGSVRRLGNPARIGQLIRDTVHDEQGITCSVGVAPTKFVAKLASGLAKPDGMVVVPRDEVVTFVQQLPVGALWGVGDKTEEALLRLGLHTVADIAHTPVDTLRRALGESCRPAPARPVLGPRPPPRRDPASRTQHRLGRDVRVRRRRPGIHPPAAAQAERPHRGAGPLRRHAGAHRLDQGAVLRLHDHHPQQDPARPHRRQPRDLRHGQEPATTRWGCSGPGSAWSGCGWRAWSRAQGAPIQGTLDEPDHGWRDADRAVDRASARFGAGSVRPASLISDRDRATVTSACQGSVGGLSAGRHPDNRTAANG